MSALPHTVFLAVDGDVVQGETICPSETCLNHVFATFPSLPERILTVFLVEAACLAPSAIGSLNPLLGKRDSLLKGRHLVYDPVIRRPKLGESHC